MILPYNKTGNDPECNKKDIAAIPGAKKHFVLFGKFVSI
jgi:hypothetical protein